MAVKSKRAPAADKPAMRYKVILASIERAERKIALAQKRLKTLRPRALAYARRLGAERVAQIEAEAAAARVEDERRAAVRREVASQLVAAARAAFALTKTAPLALPIKARPLSIAIGPSAKRIEHGTYAKRRLHGLRVEMPGRTQLVWIPGRGMATFESTQSLCLYSELKPLEASK